MHRNGYLCTFYPNSDTANEFSDPDFPIRRGYFCDRWSFAIYIKFITSGVSIRVLDKILDKVLLSSEKLDSQSPISKEMDKQLSEYISKLYETSLCRRLVTIA